MRAGSSCTPAGTSGSQPRHNPPSHHLDIYEAARTTVDYLPGEVRASRYVYGDCEWPDELADIGPALLDLLEEGVGVRFTHVLVQGYLDETATTGWHSDANFDAQAILSVGATRHLGLRRQDLAGEHFIELRDGDLFFMPSGFQDEWEHSVPAESTPCGERLSLVFRTNR